MRRPGRCPRRLILVAAALLASGCGITPAETTVAGDPPIARSTSQPTVVYFVKQGKLTSVTRPGLPGVPEYSLQQLLEGPNDIERARGLGSRAARVDTGSDIQVNRSPDGGTLSVWGLEEKGLGLAQIVCTGTAIPGVQRVIVQGRGIPVLHAQSPGTGDTTPDVVYIDPLTGQSLKGSRPYTCSDFAKYLDG
ncbi:hypothetical protein [Sphaerisporangium fuscum]|uniref:hypothetical protein n=1 Tax=Sphaerisporangium fuscum TaxID=2835868 RepID=UPI001BDDA80C|nr:hypothetical protein [Sphaerisporangium fuscum]